MPSRKPPPGKSRKPSAPKAPPVLSEVRERIDGIDRQIQALIAERGLDDVL